MNKDLVTRKLDTLSSFARRKREVGVAKLPLPLLKGWSLYICIDGIAPGLREDFLGLARKLGAVISAEGGLEESAARVRGSKGSVAPDKTALLAINKESFRKDCDNEQLPKSPQTPVHSIHWLIDTCLAQEVQMLPSYVL